MISTKKILISILGFYQGGAEIMPIRIANELYRRGYKVEIHCLKKDGSDKIKALLDERIPIHYTDRAGVLAILILTKGFSVIHTHCVASQQLVARIKHRYPFINIRHIATSHGGYEGLDEAESRKAIVEIDKATDIWTYVAENNRETFDKVGIAEDKLVKIGNAMERIGEIFPIQLSQYMIPEDAIVFTVITRAVWKKCWQECIDTIREARRITGKNIHLILGGTGPIYDELMSKPLDDFVHLIGVVTNPCNLYASSYCGMLLSVRECAPLGIIEMYNAGIPVVATDTGDVREMLCTHNGQAGMLVELDENGKVPVNNSAKAVAEMVLNHEYYEQSRLNAIDRAKDFSIEAVVNNYLEYYFSE